MRLRPWEMPLLYFSLLLWDEGLPGFPTPGDTTSVSPRIQRPLLVCRAQGHWPGQHETGVWGRPPGGSSVFLWVCPSSVPSLPLQLRCHFCCLPRASFPVVSHGSHPGCALTCAFVCTWVKTVGLGVREPWACSAAPSAHLWDLFSHLENTDLNSHRRGLFGDGTRPQARDVASRVPFFQHMAPVGTGAGGFSQCGAFSSSLRWGVFTRAPPPHSGCVSLL